MQTAAGEERRRAADRAADAELIKAGTYSARPSCCRRAWARLASCGRPAGSGRPCRFYADRVRPGRAGRSCSACCRRSASRRCPARLAQDGIAMFKRYAGPLTPASAPRRRGWMSSTAAARTGRSRRVEPTARHSPFGLPAEIDQRPAARARDNGSTVVVLRGRRRRDVPAVLVLGAPAARCSTKRNRGTLGRLLGSRAGHARRPPRQVGLPAARRHPRN